MNNESLCLDEVFQDNLGTHTPPKETVELYCEDVCEDDEPLFLDILLRMSAIIVVRRHVLRMLRLKFPLREES